MKLRNIRCGATGPQVCYTFRDGDTFAIRQFDELFNALDLFELAAVCALLSTKKHAPAHGMQYLLR